MIIPQKKPRNALFLLPNAFTTAALFCGFYAIIQALNNDWQTAAQFIVLSSILDVCDGLVARLTKTESHFGMEFDSLSDVIAFGAAPAIILYQWSLHDLSKIGLGIAFFYCSATAMRLARFNSQANRIDKRYFIGIPCPAAALLVISFMASAELLDIKLPAVVTAVICSIVAFTMISGIRYPSLKGINFKQRVPYRAGILFVVGIILINVLSDLYILVIFIILSVYLIYGYINYLINIGKRNINEKKIDISPTSCNFDDDRR